MGVLLQARALAKVADVPSELDMLIELMAYRDGVMSEALVQATNIIPYFQGLVGFTDTSHPQTTNMCIIAQSLGEFTVMLYKNMFNRPRPFQLRPELLPEMDVPGHPAYPSGHATESHLIANFLQLVIGESTRHGHCCPGWRTASRSIAR